MAGGALGEAGTERGWDFDDVRDFYLALLFKVDPVQLRRSDHERYLELSRAASGEVMAEVIGESRRNGSPCHGALVLWLKDMLPGAGLGVLDHRGLPKVAYHHLRRALAPVAVWTTDEGVNGVAIHIANDRPDPLPARLRVALYRGLQTSVAQAQEDVLLAPRATAERTVEGMLGRFVDSSWAYRFGPPAHDAVIVSLESPQDPPELLSQAVWFPAGRPGARESAARMGLEACAVAGGGNELALSIRCQRLAYGVRVHVPGLVPDDDAFSVEPGHERTLHLVPTSEQSSFAGGSLSALNLEGPLTIAALPA